MSVEGDATRRAVRIASVGLAALFLFVLIANVLWAVPSPPSMNQPRMPPTMCPFPVFRMGSILHVVTMDADSNLSTRLLMTSLQGGANGFQLHLYLAVQKVSGNTSRML